MFNSNAEFMEIIKALAISMNAQSVSLINDKKYRFYLSGERIVDIPKKEIEIEFLKQVKIDVMQ